MLSGECAADELETLLSLVARLFHDRPQRCAARARKLVETSKEHIRERARDPGARFAARSDELVTSGHPWWRPWAEADLDDFDADAAADVFDAAFASPDGFRVVVAGNLKPDDAALAALARAHPPERKTGVGPSSGRR